MRQKEIIKYTDSYRMMEMISTWMDRYHLDPIIGFLLPNGIGDVFTCVLSLPYLWFCLVQVRSIPLTIAVLNNTLIDLLLGLLPFCIGDLMDIFNRSYIRNLNMIMGYIEGDTSIRRQVKGKMVWSIILMIILCSLIYMMIRVAIWAGGIIYGFFTETVMHIFS